MGRITVSFRRYGFYTGWGYVRKLSIEAFDGFTFELGRDTFLARIIEKLIIQEDFLYTNRRTIRKEIDEDTFKILKAMKEKQAWQFWFKALEKDWTLEEIKVKLLWKIL